MNLSNDVIEHKDWLLSLVPAPQNGLWLDLGCGLDSLMSAAFGMDKHSKFRNPVAFNLDSPLWAKS